MSIGFGTTAFAADEAKGSDSGAGDEIPAKFAMKSVDGGRNVSIPYRWAAAPPGTESFALALIDTAPAADNWVHWMIVDIPPGTRGVREGASGTSDMPGGAKELRNTFGFTGYGGPQPPPGTGAHPYVATLYALDTPSLGLPLDATLAQFEQAVQGHIIASETCTGRFGR